MKRNIKRVLALTLALLVVLQMPLQVHADTFQSVSSSVAEPEEVTPTEYIYVNFFVSYGVSISAISINAESLEAAEMECKRRLSQELETIDWAYLFPYEPGTNVGIIAGSRAETNVKIAMDTLMGGQSNGKFVSTFEAFANGDSKIVDWLCYKGYDGVAGHNSINSGNWDSDINLLDKLFKRLHDVRPSVMTDSMLASWNANKNCEGSGTYIFLVTSLANYQGSSYATSEDQFETDIDVTNPESVELGEVPFMFAYDTKWGAPNRDAWFAHFHEHSDVGPRNAMYIWPTEDFGGNTAGKTELASISYVEYNGLQYYGRSYWGGAGDGSPTSPAGFLYSVEASPKDSMADLTQPQTGTYKVHIRKNGGANIVPNHIYRVEIAYSTSTRGYDNKYSSITNKEKISGTNVGVEIYAGAVGYHTNEYLGYTALIQGPYSPTRSNGTAIYQIKGSDLQSWLNGTWLPTLDFTSQAVNGNTTLLFQPEKFTLSIKDLNTGLTSVCSPDSTGKYTGWDKDTRSNWCSWIGRGDGLDIPWEYHSNYDYKAYAEIVGNKVGQDNQDWNAMQGIPSTENLSVAAGGTLFVSDFAGYVHIRGTELSPSSPAASNTGVGSPNDNSVIDRNINIIVSVENIWGENNVCELSCPKHTETITKTHIANVQCSLCKRTYSSSQLSLYPSCSWSPSVDCSNNSIDDNGGSHEGSLTLSDSGQSYYGTIVFTKGDETITITAGTSSVQCEGYTSGKGCTHSGETNCVHRETKTYTFPIKETIDLFAWKEIIAGKVYGLSDATITGVDINVIDDSAVGMAGSMATGQSTLWRGVGYREGNKNVHDMYGRFYYTQFFPTSTVQSVLNSGNSGLVSSIQYNVNDGSVMHSVAGVAEMGYNLTNVDIVIHVNANSQLGDAADPGALDALSSGFVGNRGDTVSGLYGSPTSSSESYKGHYGDKMTDTQCKNQALHVANAFQHMHKDYDFTVTVMSDSYNNGSHYSTGSVFDTGTGYQQIISAVYSVDAGIKLFNHPFSTDGETHYRNHRSQFSVEQLKGMASGSFSYKTQDGNALVGYNGMPSGVASAKYGYFGASLGSAQTLSGSTLWSGYPYAGMGNDFNLSVAGSVKVNPLYIGLNRRKVENPEGLKVNESVTQGLNGGFINTISFNTWQNGTFVGDGHLGEIVYSPEKFVGYYRSHDYNAKADNLTVVVDSSDDSNIRTLTSVTDNGVMSVAEYGAPYTISNIPIKDNARNGVYSEAITVMCNWNVMLDFNNQSSQEGLATLGNKIPNRNDPGKTGFSRKAVYSDTYTNVKGATGVINDIIIHDPISVQYYGIIGNGYGSYANGVVDESGEDMRIYERTLPDGSTEWYSIDEEKDKTNYIVVGNTFHLWVSDFGDFRDANGSWAAGSASLYRGVNSVETGSSSADGSSNPNARGYTDNMNTGPWVKERYVQFTFPVAYTATNGTIKAIPAGTLIALSDVKSINANGEKGYVEKDWGNFNNGSWSGSLKWNSKAGGASNLFHYGSEALQNFSNTDIEYKCGLDYEFLLLPSAQESTDAVVRYYVKGINTKDSDDCAPSYNNKNRHIDYYADTCLYKEDHVAIVGRIGNLAIEDVGDFRYSELFKHVEDYNRWLIPGVIHQVNSSIPETIIATRYDIMGDDTYHTNYTHAQSSITNYVVGTNYGLGKAGDWLPFPLVASQNPVKEFQDEQMRMGYYAYLDIETMGNYYGINIKPGTSDVLDPGPTSVDDLLNPSFKDNREYKMDIVPRYFLYDMDSDKFIGINLYYGNQGNRVLFWKNGEDISTDITALYNSVSAENGRRNITSSEETLTRYILNKLGPSMRASAFGDSDFIGTASKIVLDTFDKTYIGSTIRNGYVKQNQADGSLSGVIAGPIASEWFTGSGWTGRNDSRATSINDSDFGYQQQRWYFTMGLPSSTYLTYADNSLTTQSRIEESHDKLMRDHPNSVLICYLDIRVTGTVWTLGYDASLVNDSSRYPNIVPGKPFPRSPIPIPVYDKDGNPTGEIDPEWQPTIVYDKEKTSADDWSTYGTH